ncbi:succinate receptor 1-like [Oncorhynchus kisutch]|uniref:succinate receptor 1-like n=1 Tax=Oncorhynchus kisutch TaxID=8019 RepID=UPI0012DC8D9F|nr:succinate receptor 1-like [Oncorhynchus kisutch]
MFEEIAFMPPERAFCDLSSPGQEGIRVVQLYLMPAFFLGVLILGLPLNLLSLWIFFQRLKRWSRSSVLLFNLAMADTFWLLALPFLIHYHLNGLHWGLGVSLCKTLRLLYHNYFYLSIFFVSCVSVDRYLAIVHPLRSVVLLGRRQTCFLCAVIWAISMVISVPVAHMTLLQHCPGDNNRTVCTLYMLLDDTEESLPYSICCTTIGFLVPLNSICYCCLRSIRELRLRSRRPQVHLHKNKGRRLRLTRVLTAVLTLFALFYLPYHLSRNAAIVMHAMYLGRPAFWQPVDLAFCLEICLCSLNTCVNPLFTCFVGRQFRKEFQDTFGFAWLQLWKSQRQQSAVNHVASVTGLFERKRNQRTIGHEREGHGGQGLAAVTPL